MWIIQQHQKQKCSECGAVDTTEKVTRGSFANYKEYLRCIGCGHEKLIYECSSLSTTGEYVTYKLPKKPEFEIF